MDEPERAPRDLLMAVVIKTAAEVSAGTMGPRRALEELVVLHGQYANFCQRFGIKQGIDSSGKIKYRCIDNHATSGVNDAASRMQKILMSNIASIMLLIVRYESILRKAGLLGPEWSLVGATEDLKAAYRQCPLSDSMLSLCLVMFYNPSTGVIDCHESFGMPFGAGHAVPNFYRMAQWCAVVGRRFLKLPIDHFFDDFWIVEPKCLAHSGVWAFRSLMEACGFVLDPGKSQLPATVWFALGVAFDMQTLRAQSKLFVKPRTKRLVNILGGYSKSGWITGLPPLRQPGCLGSWTFLIRPSFEKLLGRDCSQLTFKLKAAISWLSSCWSLVLPGRSPFMRPASHLFFSIPMVHPIQIEILFM